MGNWISTEERERFPLTIRKTRKYGWKPDLPDQRDIMASFPSHIKAKQGIDLRSSGFMPDVYNQGELGSCTANAIAGAFEFDQRKQQLDDFMPSRLFIYYNERAIEGSVDTDAGASIRDGVKVVNRLGVCPETDCPYDINYFTEKPTDQAYMDASKHKSVNYRSLRINVDDLMKSLSHGFPVVFGFSVYESFEGEAVARTGIMPLPKSGEKILGGHAVMAVGYDSKRQFILVRNSWSEGWGQKGYFWMPYKFFTPRNCADAWIIQRVKDDKKPMITPTAPTAPTAPKEPKEPKKSKEPEPKLQVVKEDHPDYEFKDVSDNEDDELLEDDIE